MIKKMLYIVISIITIGFSLINNNNNSSFYVDYENIQVKEATDNLVFEECKDGISYNIELNKPGDFYEFTIDLVNKSSKEVKVDNITLSTLTERQKKYLDYNVSYIDGSQIKVNDLIKAKSSKTLKVTIYFKEDIEPSDLPSKDEILDLGLSVNITPTD